MGPERRPGRFGFEIATPLRPSAALERILDVRLHGELVPLTRGSGPRPEEATVGSRLVARTAVGPVGFDDVMEVAELDDRPRRVVLEKTGSVVGGRIVVECTPTPTGSVVAWQQELEVPFLPGALGSVLPRLVAPVAARGYRFVVGRLLSLLPDADAAHGD